MADIKCAGGEVGFEQIRRAAVGYFYSYRVFVIQRVVSYTSIVKKVAEQIDRLLARCLNFAPGAVVYQFRL